MRRFYGGANGPRPLILPTASQTAMSTIPAPNERTLAPTTPDTPPRTEPLSGITSRRTPSRSASLDEGASTITRSRGSRSSLNLTDFKARNALIKHGPTPSQTMSVQSIYEEEEQEGDAVGSDDDDLMDNRRDSMGSIEGLNLYDELRTFHELSSPSVSTSSPPVAGTEGLPAVGVALHPSPTGGRGERSVDGAAELPIAQGPVAKPLRLLRAMATAMSHTVARQTPDVRNVFANAWDVVTISRPVLEFRWWLIKILLGDLLKKQALWPQQPALSQAPRRSPARRHGLAMSVAPGTGLATSETDERTLMQDNHDRVLLECLNHVERSGRGERRTPQPPILHWLRFGVTLMFAVGIALRNGPKVLFQPQQPTPGRRNHSRKLEDSADALRKDKTK